MSKPFPEFSLAVACCRWPLTPDRLEAVRALSQGVDWPLFERVAVRHRIEGLVWNALRKAGAAVPPEVAAGLASSSVSIAAQNLQLAAESARLRDLFEAEAIDLLFVKGLTLAARAYGTVALKKGWDIDVLVPRETLQEAARVLQAAGYQMIIPGPPAGLDQLAVWDRASKETVWRDRRGVHVELHTRLSDNPRLIPSIGIESPRQDVDIASGIVLPTLSDDPLFAYLCVHGASSGWFRLKWLADLAALLAGTSEAEVRRLYDVSQRLGAGRSADLALLLVARLFEVRLPPDLSARLAGDRVNRWLVRGALRLLAGPGAAAELESIPLGTLSIHLMQLGLRPGLGFAMSELRRQLRSPEDAVRGVHPLLALPRRILASMSARARR